MSGEAGQIAVRMYCNLSSSVWIGSVIIPCLLYSALFPDVVNCMQTDNLELKKLVYLYLMNYAKSQPDMAIMAVNTFVKVKLRHCYVKTLFRYQDIIYNFCIATAYFTY